MTGSETGTNVEAEESGQMNVVVENLTTGYGNHEVLHDVSIQSHDNVTAVFGPNGSGKSTLMKAIAGTVPVWSGNVTFKGRDITDAPSHKVVEAGLATLPQDGGLFGSLTVRENLQLGAYSVRDQTVIEERMEEVFEAFPIVEEKLDARSRSLSGGQQMMLGFGCAMMTGADTYLLDEPTAGLAPNLVDDALEMIERLIEQDTQIILVEQNVSAGLRVADHVYLLAQGSIQFDGPPSELADEDELIELYLGIG
jgi:ABC-type branched-subunit amino acid transport system ATPase component